MLMEVENSDRIRQHITNPLPALSVDLELRKGRSQDEPLLESCLRSKLCLVHIPVEKVAQDTLGSYRTNEASSLKVEREVQENSDRSDSTDKHAYIVVGRRFGRPAGRLDVSSCRCQKDAGP
jgi:hypothetical protein